jgi:hypothetical protein
MENCDSIGFSYDYYDSLASNHPLPQTLWKAAKKAKLNFMKHAKMII